MLDQKIIYFMTVVEEKSFSGASRKLFLSQPNLSKQVSLLEKELGVTLFDRTGYRPVLTDAGEIFYKECKKIQKQFEKVYKKLQELEVVDIEIGFTGSFENRKILKAINQFKQENSQVMVSFNKYNFENLTKNLLNRRVDISFGLESNFLRYRQIQYDVLYSYDICVICSFGHPLAELNEIGIDQIKKEDMIILSPNYGMDFYNDYMEACRRDGFVPKVKKEVESFDELVFDVSIGEGIAIVSKDVVRENEVKIIDLLNSHHSSKYVMAYLNKEQNPTIQRFIDSIKSTF